MVCTNECKVIYCMSEKLLCSCVSMAIKEFKTALIIVEIQVIKKVKVNNISSVMRPK